MIFERLFEQEKIARPTIDKLQVGSRVVPLLFVHHPRARRYLLRLQSDGVARITIPRRGSISAARDFASRNVGWLEQQFKRLADQPKSVTQWKIGVGIHFRGDLVHIETDAEGLIRFGTERIKVRDPSGDLGPSIQKHMYKLAAQELPARVMELGALHGVDVSSISIRNQRSRWGSCSLKGTISLNWRLIQTPVYVRDYIILHELAHRRQMNHSEQFWREMERWCPDYLQAERWLKQHGELLR